MTHHKVKACAKINLTLELVGKREDGYHLLETIFQSVSLCDRLDISTRKDNRISVRSSLETLGGNDDITYKAAKAFFMASEINGGADIKIEKNIPLSAGLGGGSSDAAAVLLALNELHNKPLTDCALNEIALSLGADVPYFFTGGAAFVSGIGEKVKNIGCMPKAVIMIAKCGVKKSTADMYRKVDLIKNLPKPNNRSAINAIKQNDLESLCNCLGNSFDAVWDFEETKNAIIDMGAKAVSLSGSGPSIFAIFTDVNLAQNAKILLNEKFGFEVFLTEPTEKSVYFE